jgi:homocitrate synthase NifV
VSSDDSNALAAVAAGAEVDHASVLGISERAGDAPLEEVATAARTPYGCERGLDLSLMTSLAKEVAEISGFPRAANKPLTGTRPFTRESGMGIELIRGVAPRTLLHSP